jgi:glycosyltransferase involved in cell wall biosynthesis
MKFIIKKNIKNVDWKKIHVIINIFILCCLIIMNLNQELSFEIFPLKEIKNIESYLNLCNISNISQLYFSDLKKFPKISIISTIYNRGAYLLRFLKSIQNQNFSDIEIILIDDFSSDNSVELIKQYKSIEKRIILIRNKKNFGTFKSRNIGVLKSKGKYIILPDPDDILSQDSLKIFYTFANKYSYEMLRFNMYIGRNNIHFSNCANQTPSRPVFQPEIKTFLFYATKKLKQIDFNVANKFIKRDALIRTLNLLNKEYFNTLKYAYSSFN